VTDAPSGLQLDLVTVVARLRQIKADGGCGFYGEPLALLLWDRVMTCDLPRLEGHLTEASLAFLERAEENWPES
jgi:hypothetical protein